jgi:hypothetical protein
MQNFSSPASIQTDIAEFWTFFPENNLKKSENFTKSQKTFKRLSKNTKSEYAAKLASTQIFWTFFHENFKILQKNSSEIQKNLNLIMKFDVATSKVYSCKISTL